jgi:hypothetical protein
MKRFLMIIVCAASLGCVFGTKVSTMDVANQPSGTAAKITLQGGMVVNAALLAVSDTDITILRSDTVWSMAYRRAEGMTFTDVPVRLANGRRPTPAERDRLRLASRFPQGLSPDLEARLLAAYHQSAVAGLVK